MRHSKVDMSQPMQGHQSVFRVPNYKSQSTGTHGPVGDPTERVYHSRRTHRKSRGGCATCKSRRVKCDESKPHCLRCQKHGVECNYTAAPVRTRPTKHVVQRFLESRPDLLSTESLAISMSLLVVADKLNELLQPEPPSPSSSSSSSSSQTISPGPDRALEALHHFHQATFHSDLSKSDIGAMMGKVTQLAFETPLLMHAIIGVATTHLCSVIPNNCSYRVAESYHWQQAIQRYTHEISSGVTEKNMDPLYSACILLTIHSFRLGEFNPRASFVFSDNPTDLNWLRLQGGLRYLLDRTQRWMPDSMWFTLFEQSRYDEFSYDDDRPGRIDLDPDLADVCRITETSTVTNNPYLWPLRMLTNLLALGNTKENYRNYYYNWMGRLEPEYYDCLLRKDPLH
ncbi:transcriptional regulator family: Fungal Specific TF [Penicillium argentinense]|uniref:Transcriptional regulator family: Fungal Specific TF n=1 Tax=Penicillium argentinense TaxID=1131581 RepID=A0A9W9EZT0_9EURO|nr:transcriptional regulator family: Fungal Specific TF [Penicillium argentinense]KAJ5090926.1 transcriptional regulator family: Fungal Specific TF [Penicillium argentinense]